MAYFEQGAIFVFQTSTTLSMMQLHWGQIIFLFVGRIISNEFGGYSPNFGQCDAFCPLSSTEIDCPFLEMKAKKGGWGTILTVNV